MTLSKNALKLILPLVLVTVIPMVAIADNDDLPVTEVAVSITNAMSIALEQVGGNVVGVELEQEDGVTLWEVEVIGADSKPVEVMIDAQTGAVIEIEADD